MRVYPLCLAMLLQAAAGCANTRSTCTLNTDCHTGSYCVHGACHTDCRANYDCTVGYCEIVTGRCLTDDGGMSQPKVDMAMGTNPVLDFSMNVEPPPDFAMEPPPKKGAYGDNCAAGADCDSTICSRDPFTSVRECTGPCNADSDCMLGDNCVIAVNTCAQSDIGNSCNGPNDCRQGACLGGNGGGPAVCTRTCTNAAQCPAGWACSPVGNVRVCVDVDVTQPCNGPNQCWYGTICEGNSQRCMAACRSALDCPLFHTCTQGVCLPDSPGRGGIGAGCQTGDDCRSGRCAGTCVGACGVTSNVGQWCPAGYGCNPIGDGMGGWVLVCLPSGTGAPGAACVDNASCGSALCIDKPGYCTRFCNSAPCPANEPKCVAIGVVADGVTLKACSK